MVQIKGPYESNDAGAALELITEFAHQYGYVAQTDLDTDSNAGDAYVKAFGYSGKLHLIKYYGLRSDNDQSLPYWLDLEKGENGDLFINISLRSEESSVPVSHLMRSIIREYGKDRVRVAKPTMVDWLLMGG
jgi:hypothetical protein